MTQRNKWWERTIWRYTCLYKSVYALISSQPWWSRHVIPVCVSSIVGENLVLSLINRYMCLSLRIQRSEEDDRCLLSFSTLLLCARFSYWAASSLSNLGWLGSAHPYLLIPSASIIGTCRYTQWTGYFMWTWHKLKSYERRDPQFEECLLKIGLQVSL